MFLNWSFLFRIFGRERECLNYRIVFYRRELRNAPKARPAVPQESASARPFVESRVAIRVDATSRYSGCKSWSDNWKIKRAGRSSGESNSVPSAPLPNNPVLQCVREEVRIHNFFVATQFELPTSEHGTVLSWSEFYPAASSGSARHVWNLRSAGFMWGRAGSLSQESPG